MFRATAGTQYASDSDTNTMFTGDATMLDDFVQGDVFRAQAEVVGSYDYDTQEGGNTTVPELRIVSIKKI